MLSGKPGIALGRPLTWQLISPHILGKWAALSSPGIFSYPADCLHSVTSKHSHAVQNLHVKEHSRFSENLRLKMSLKPSLHKEF